MKKIILSLMLSVLGVTTFVWALEIKIATDKAHIDINEHILLDVKISDEGRKKIWGAQISIKWLENFEQIGRQQNSTIQQVINGKPSVIQTITLPLKSRKKGKYTLGPAEITLWTGHVVSNTLKIDVSGDKMFVGNASSNMVNQLKTSPKWELFDLGAPILDSQFDWDIIEEKISFFASTNLWYISGVIVVIALILLIIVRKVFHRKHHYEQETELSQQVIPLKERSPVLLPNIEDNNFWFQTKEYILWKTEVILCESIESKTFSEIQELDSFLHLPKDLQATLQHIFSALMQNTYKQPLTSKQIQTFYEKLKKI